MITGIVNGFREPMVSLRLLGTDGREQTVEVLVDTGFTGGITLPPILIAELGLPFLGRSRALLADGSEKLLDLFEASVLWEGSPRRAPIHAADADPLLGMGLLYGHELSVQVVEGGSVTIQDLPFS